MTKEGDIEEAASMEVPMEEFDMMMGLQDKNVGTMDTKDTENVHLRTNANPVATFTTGEEDMNRRMMYAAVCLCVLGAAIVGAVVGSILPNS